MAPPEKIVISASRRTDIPAFYLDWFMQRLARGYFEVVNPYNRLKSKVPASPDQVHTFVFWSKNFGPFLQRKIGEKLLDSGYNLFFNFTVNSAVGQIEPRVPPLKNRLDQMEKLGRRFDPRSINWRFDPICFFRSGSEPVKNNLKDFKVIAATAAGAGIQRCTTSFMDDYAKIGKRTAEMNGFTFYDPSLNDKVGTLLEMEAQLFSTGISLYTCCEKAVLEALPPESTVKQSACIPNNVLVEHYGGNLSLRKDTGQRRSQGCGCMVSKDIGSYHLHPCFHNCLFCYANPSSAEYHTAGIGEKI